MIRQTIFSLLQAISWRVNETSSEIGQTTQPFLPQQSVMCPKKQVPLDLELGLKQAQHDQNGENII